MVAGATVFVAFLVRGGEQESHMCAVLVSEENEEPIIIEDRKSGAGCGTIGRSWSCCRRREGLRPGRNRLAAPHCYSGVPIARRRTLNASKIYPFFLARSRPAFVLLWQLLFFFDTARE